MFVYCRKTFRFTGPDGRTFVLAEGHIGDVPDWIGKDWLFKRAMAAGDITLPASRTDAGVVLSTVPAPRKARARKDAAVPAP